MKRKSKKSTWLIAALVAFILFIGSIAGNLLSSYLEEGLRNYRPWIIALTAIAGAVAVIAAIMDARSKQADVAENHLQVVEDYHMLLRRYLSAISAKLRFLPLKGIDLRNVDSSSSRSNPMNLADIYISLDTTTRIVDEKNPNQAKRYLSAIEAVLRSNQLVILGEPGSGKTTFMNYLAYCVAESKLNSNSPYQDEIRMLVSKSSFLIPISVVLREFSAWIADTKPEERKVVLFQEYVKAMLKELGLTRFHAPLCGHIESGTALPLLDGLDEIGTDSNTLLILKDAINSLRLAYPTTPIVVSCRILSYQDKTWQLSSDWPTYELNTLHDAQIDKFIDSWYVQLALQHIVENPHALSTRLKQAVRQASLWQLATNPLLLTTMALVHTHKGELPSARAVLYEDVIELLLWRWETTKADDLSSKETNWKQLLQDAQLSEIDIRQCFWELAFHTHEKTEKAISDIQNHASGINDSDLLKALASVHPDRSYDWANRLVEIIRLRAGLLIESKPGSYSFPHRTFQEYLAGCYLSNQADFVDRAIKLSSKGSYWRHVVLFAVGRLVHVNGEIDRPLMLLNELISNSSIENDSSDSWRKIWLAGEGALEIGLKRINRRVIGDALITQARDLLCLLISSDKLEPRERSEAGSTLGGIGDPRRLTEYVQVPAGPFIMGSTDEEIKRFSQLLADEFRADDVPPELAYELVRTESPQHELYLDEYLIGKYPITNLQYLEFVNKTGNPAPRHWRGKEPSPRIYNHPVVWVTRNDAEAYCLWLSNEIGQDCKLPSEAEWEKAARGVDGRYYPWGNDFDPKFCNMKDTGIGSTSPVGIFARNVSPYGCYDMAGNVWEWTRTLWEHDENSIYGYPYIIDDGREREKPSEPAKFVLRGGSFAFNRYSARVAYRDKRASNDLRHGYIGFRVVIHLRK